MHKDLLNIVLASAICAIAFSIFDYGKIFLYFLYILFFFLLNFFSKYFFSKYLGFDVKSKFLTINRYWFGDQYKIKYPIPIWIFIFIVSFITFNAIKLLTVLGFEYRENIERVKRKFEYAEYDITKISIVSLLVCFFTTVILFYIDRNFAFIGIWFVLSNILPFGSLDGARIFYSNWIVWFFYFVFFFFTFIFMNTPISFLSLLFSLILACCIGVYFLYKYIK
jgi:hypothetical protein